MHDMAEMRTEALQQRNAKTMRCERLAMTAIMTDQREAWHRGNAERERNGRRCKRATRTGVPNAQKRSRSAESADDTAKWQLPVQALRLHASAHNRLTRTR